MRCNQTLFLASALSLLFIASASADTAAESKQVFDTLFAAKIKSVSATVDRADDVVLAKEMLSLAKTSTGQSALVVLLCDAVHDLGMKHADGYAVAVEAQQYLADTVVERLPAAREKLIAVLTKQSAAGKPDEREPAGEALINLLTVMGEEKAERKQYAEAAADYRRALALAQQKKSDSLDEVKAKMEFALSRDRAMKQLARLQEKLLKDATDSATAEEIVTLCVVEFDDPAAAVVFLNRVKDGQMKALVPLAAGRLDEVAVEDALKLGEWYKSLADRNRAPAVQPPLLSRAEQYLARFLANESTGGVVRTKAEVLLKEVKAFQEKLVVKTSDPKTPAKKRESVLTILEAKYGVSEAWIDVTKDVRAMMKGQSLAVMAGHEPVVPRDPKPGVTKRLVVRYKLGNTERTTEASDGEMLALIAPDAFGQSEKLKIIEAKYGAGRAWLDLTVAVAKQANGKEETLILDWGALNAGDPAPFRRKAFVVFYIFQGQAAAKIVPEGSQVKFP